MTISCPFFYTTMQAFFNNSRNSSYNVRMAGGRPTKKIPTQLGSRIAEARNNAGLSQNELAEKTGLKRHLIAHWERQAISLKAEQLIILSDALNIPTDYLLGKIIKKSGGGPEGRAKKLFNEVASLPRRQKERVLATIEDAVLAQKAKKAS